MADNVIVTQETNGPVVATDEISGIHFPKSKINLGTDNVDGGLVGIGNPLPIIRPADQEGENHTYHAQDVLMKPVADPIYSGIPFNSAADVDLFISSGVATLTNLWVCNRSTTALWIQIHNKASVVTAGNTAIFWYPLKVGSSTDPYIAVLGPEILGRHGIYVDLGISIGISTAKTTFTAYGTPADIDIGGFYAVNS